MIKQPYYMRQYHRKLILALIPAVILAVIVVSVVFAHHHVQRPILDDGGIINQWYLYGEENEHRGIDLGVSFLS